MLIKETSERSKEYNIAEKQIHTIPELLQVEFEGISTRDKKIACLLDRGKADCSISKFLEEYDAIEEIKKIEPHFEIKVGIANKIGVPWVFVIYSYEDNQCIAFNLADLSKDHRSYESFLTFGNWLSKYYTDKTENFSAYQESGLPQFDVELRKNKTPWPGNVDGILFMTESKELLCVLEYQNTSATTVRLHDNNNYIYSTSNRKGDNKRWMVQDVLSKALGLKVIVVVWSKNEQDIGLKLVDSFKTDTNGLVTHINWGKKEFLNVAKLSIDNFLNLLNIKSE